MSLSSLGEQRKQKIELSEKDTKSIEKMSRKKLIEELKKAKKTLKSKSVGTSRRRTPRKKQFNQAQKEQQTPWQKTKSVRVIVYER